MKTTHLFAVILLFFVWASCTETAPSPSDSKAEREFYQLKTYLFASPEQEQITDQYLQHAYLPALKKMNIRAVGVFKNRPTGEDSVRKTYVLIPFPAIGTFLSLEQKLMADTAYLEAGKGYLSAPHDQPPYERIESVFMRAFPDMPKMQASAVSGPRSERIYELRSYESSTEALNRSKVDMFNAGGEIKLFDRLDFNAVFYAEVLSGNKMPNLMYMTSFPDRASRDTLWKAFFESPEWTELKSLDKYKNTVSHADIMLLYPTEYSDY